MENAHDRYPSVRNNWRIAGSYTIVSTATAGAPSLRSNVQFQFRHGGLFSGKHALRHGFS
jgi:hypothetical protein